MVTPTAPLRALVLLLAGVLLLLAGCSGLEGSGDKGYVTANGAVRELDPDERDAPKSIEGVDLDGKPISLADYRGRVVVLNVWGDWCGECHAEAGDVVGAAEETQGDEVTFVGINVRDPSPEQAKSFVRQYDVPFRSFYDPSGETLLQFHGTLTAISTPATVVLDREGRVAGSVLGVLPSQQTLVSMIEKVVAEDG